MSQDELAKKISIHALGFGSYEKSEVKFIGEKAAKIAEALNVSLFKVI